LIVQSAVDTMDAKAACLFLTDTKKNVFELAAQTELTSDYFHAKQLKIGKLVDTVLSDGHLSIRNATTDPCLEHHTAKKAECIASILIVPVMLNNEPLGVLSLYSGRSREFSEDEIEFLTALADLGGIALMHVNLIDRIMKKFVFGAS